MLPLHYTTPYPTHAHTGLASDMGRDISLCGAPVELIGMQLTAIIAFLTQGVADVMSPNGLKSPAGANVLAVAPSVSGKSLVFDMLTEPIQFILVELGKEAGTDKRLIFFHEDSTREAIISGLTDWPVGALATDEAEMILKLFKYAATLVKLVDCTPLHYARLSTGRVELIGHRFMLFLLVQHGAFEDIKHLLVAGRSGLITRMLVGRAAPMTMVNTFHGAGLTESVSAEYKAKIKALMKLTIDQVAKLPEARPVVKFKSDAAHFLAHLTDRYAGQQAPGTPMEFADEYVRRHVQRTIRLAGALHVFHHGAEGEITQDTLQCANLITEWHLAQFKNMFFVPPKLTKVEIDAKTLEAAIRQTIWSSGLTAYDLDVMRKLSVNFGFSPPRLNRALEFLGAQKKLRVTLVRGKPWVEVNTAYFNNGIKC